MNENGLRVVILIASIGLGIAAPNCGVDEHGGGGTEGKTGSGGSGGGGHGGGTGGMSGQLDSSVGTGGRDSSVGTGGAAGAGGSGGSAGSGGSEETGGASGSGGDASDAGDASVVVDAGCPICRVGPALYWKFDEPGGTVAIDSSGNHFDGAYVSAGQSLPAPSAIEVAPVSFDNPYSRTFIAAQRHAVLLSDAPDELKQPNNLTVSVWYRALKTEAKGSEVVSLGDVYLLRLLPQRLEWTVNSAGGYAHCYGPQVDAGGPAFLDGKWHHLAAVKSPLGMWLYLDGALQCSLARGEDIAYTKGNDFYAGRHGTDSTNYDFDGNIDEVRVYTRALEASEIVALAKGGNGPGDDAGVKDASVGDDATSTVDASVGDDATSTVDGPVEGGEEGSTTSDAGVDPSDAELPDGGEGDDGTTDDAADG